MNHIVFTLSLVLITNLLYGQSAFNFKAGVNLSNTRSDFGQSYPNTNTAHHKNEVNGYAGVSAEFRISPAFYFVPELAYMGMGYKNPENALLNSTRLYYVTLPLSFKYQANERFSVNTGVYASYLLGSEGISKILYSNPYASKESFADLDGGILLGGEYLFNANWGLGIRYLYGLLDIDKNTLEDDNLKMANRGLQFYVFYRLKKNPK